MYVFDNPAIWLKVYKAIEKHEAENGPYYSNNTYWKAMEYNFDGKNVFRVNRKLQYIKGFEYGRPKSAEFSFESVGIFNFCAGYTVSLEPSLQRDFKFVENMFTGKALYIRKHITPEQVDDHMMAILLTSELPL